MPKDQFIHYRVAGNLFILLIHSRNLISAANSMNELLPKYPELKRLNDLGPRYATVWNLTLQLGYSILALICDVSVLLNKESLISENIRKLRYTIFSGLVFPVGTGILVFWIYYFYDREGIFPKIANLIIPFEMNLMCHGGVAIYVTWELFFLPRGCSENSLYTFTYTYIFFTVYIAMLFFTRYVDKGIWCYEFMTNNENNPIFLYPLMSLPLVASFSTYYLQWRISDAIWRHRDLSLST